MKDFFNDLYLFAKRYWLINGSDIADAFICDYEGMLDYYYDDIFFQHLIDTIYDYHMKYSETSSFEEWKDIIMKYYNLIIDYKSGKISKNDTINKMKDINNHGLPIMLKQMIYLFDKYW